MTNMLELRDVMDADLPIFFGHQLNLDVNSMAPFSVKDNRGSLRVLV
jgi:hypothetical protein